MLVGYNLDAEEPYLRRVHERRAHGDPRDPMKMWRKLYELLAAPQVDRGSFFFTNVYVGARRRR